MGDEGLQLTNETSNDDTRLRNQQETGAAHGLHFGPETPQIDRGLSRLVDAWPALGDETKRAFLALVETVVTNAD